MARIDVTDLHKANLPVDLPADLPADSPAAVDPTGMRQDAKALERFYLGYYDEVVRYVVRRVADPYDVADLVADTFLSAVDAAESYDPRRGKPLPWLIGIAHNHLRRFYRQRENDRRAVQKFVGRRLLDPDDVAELVERIDAEANTARIEQSWSKLTAAQRELIDLADIQGLSPSEIATVFDIPSGVARIRLHRARKALRKAFHGQEDST
jgi:RNA polymerase sigma-70 factor (ECF subfamily)